MSETIAKYRVYTVSPFTGANYDSPKVLVKITGNTGAIDAKLLMESIQRQLDAVDQDEPNLLESQQEDWNNE